jgi:hypothetical protein
MHSDARSDAIRRNHEQSACTQTHAQTQSDAIRRNQHALRRTLRRNQT